uniref:Neur_chan_memb domain-containing protein n=1 Tax=Rhabditophanes sp. KR3021 TaxID=114890 RepID=A0AC35TGY3_9BILA
MEKLFLNFLPWLFMMRRKGYIFKRGKCYENVNDQELFVKPIMSDDTFDYRIKSVSPGKDAQIIMLHRIFMELKEIVNRCSEDEAKALVENDWKFIAMTVDRICLIMFSLFIVIFTFAFLLSAPQWIT